MLGCEQELAQLGRERGDDGERERERVIRFRKLWAGALDQLLAYGVRHFNIESDQESHAKSSSGTMTATPTMVCLVPG